jgi:hypothetical protein
MSVVLTIFHLVLVNVDIYPNRNHNKLKNQMLKNKQEHELSLVCVSQIIVECCKNNKIDSDNCREKKFLSRKVFSVCEEIIVPEKMIRTLHQIPSIK